ncbi:hypothetical protein KSP39_PZI009520 [Platanthera zijinensis]|uniref:Uncharacterized protein n=1 Tax=Platanthera zijinensis TaxID=2320716 RepID=A0AAP0BM69_9ASPA
MSRRTRRPKIFSENSGHRDEGQLEEEEDHAAHRHSSLKELMAETDGRRNTGEGSFKSAEFAGEEKVEDEAVEVREFCFEGRETGEKRSSAVLVVERKGSFVGKYMKVLNRLIKAKSYPAKRGSVILLPLK